MKKQICLIMAVLLLISLFAGCGGQTQTTGAPAVQESEENSAPSAESSVDDSNTQAEPEQTEPVEPEETPAVEPEPVEDEGGYHYAAGKYEVDEKGFPLEPYSYDLPLTDNDDVITVWTTTWSPNAIPDEGYGSMEYPKYLHEQTGVNVEYIIITSDKLRENFAVLLAADDLADLSSSGTVYYTGTIEEGIEDEWFANLYDYKEYMPNYVYQATHRGDSVYSRIFYKENIIPTFYGLYADPIPAQGMMCRKDWADELGIDVANVTTYDKLHELLLGYKSLGVESPMTMYITIERSVGYCFAGFNTTAYLNYYGLPTARVNNGTVEFCQTTEDDRDLMTMLSTWYAEDLIDKNWAANSNNTAIQSALTTNKIGYATFTPGEINDLEHSTDDDDVEWYALPRTKRTDDQTLGFGQATGHFSFGSWAVNAKSENIPLIVTYTDWLYSPEGSFITSYGVPGYTYEYDEEGNIRLTDVILNNPQGVSASWAQMLYALNPLSDAGMEIQTRKYAMPGGERYEAMHRVWIVDNYKGEYDYPSVTYTDEQTEELGSYTNDVITYLNENYMAFIDGSKPMSEWDDYVQALEELGIGRCREIYQDAYEAYLDRFDG